MSSNPFESPVAKNDVGPEANQPFPTGVLAVSILCLIFGLLGLCSTCMTGVFFAMSDTFMGMMPAEARESFRELNETQFIPTMVQLVIGAIFGPLMVVACIGCFTRKQWGRGLMVIAALGFVLWNFLAICMSVWLVTTQIESIAAPNVPTMGKDGAIQMAYFGQGFAILFSVAFLAFYVFVAIYMTRQSVKDFFDDTYPAK